MTTTMPFVCSICEEESTRICVTCTKDTCANHLCEKCGACSDCCDCELRLDPDSESDPEGAGPSGPPPGSGSASS
jgi:hypothetical protein